LNLGVLVKAMELRATAGLSLKCLSFETTSLP